MKESLYELWQANGQHMIGVIIEGEKVLFNGNYFSDAHMFINGNEYKVLEVEDIGFLVESNYDREEQFIFPDGLSSFEKNE